MLHNSLVPSNLKKKKFVITYLIKLTLEIILNTEKSKDLEIV